MNNKEKLKIFKMKLIETRKQFKNYRIELKVLKISKMNIKNKFKKRLRKKMIYFLIKRIKFLI